MNLRPNLYKITGQNNKEFFVLAKNIQDASKMYEPLEGCGAAMQGIDSIQKVEWVKEFTVTEEATKRIIEDVIKEKP